MNKVYTEVIRVDQQTGEIIANSEYHQNKWIEIKKHITYLRNEKYTKKSIYVYIERSRQQEFRFC